MHILIFTEGTILMHEHARGLSREHIVKQVKVKESSVRDYSNYIPIGDAVEILNNWITAGHKISYLTSRRALNEIGQIRNVLSRHNFPSGELFFRKPGESYSDVVERVMPDVLIEDDCESIGGVSKMCITNVDPKKKSKIQSIIVKEFAGIDQIEFS